MRWKTAVSQTERLMTAKGRAQTGLYAVEGMRLLERALRAGVPIQTVLADAEKAAAPDERLTAVLQAVNQNDIPLFLIPSAELSRLTNGRSLGGVIAHLPVPQPPNLADLLTADALLLTAVNIIDPGNCGAMVRTAHASGCAGVVTVGQTDPFHPKAVRTSMGSLFKMQIVPFETVDSLLMQFAEQGVVTVGTAVTNGKPLPDVQFPNRPTALLMGNEYFGLPDELLKKLDVRVSIPMVAGVDSFSVNAATAVLLYEINRQRGGL